MVTMVEGWVDGWMKGVAPLSPPSPPFSLFSVSSLSSSSRLVCLVCLVCLVFIFILTSFLLLFFTSSYFSPLCSVAWTPLPLEETLYGAINAAKMQLN